jgi:hypothetical protein
MSFDDDLSSQESVTVTGVHGGYLVQVGYHGVKESDPKVYASKEVAEGAGEAILKRIKADFEQSH